MVSQAVPYSEWRNEHRPKAAKAGEAAGLEVREAEEARVLKHRFGDLKVRFTWGDV